MRTGNLFVISGPSGAGKGTLVALLIAALDDAQLSISATTRTPREGEQQGKSYYFLDDEEFDRRIAAGDFLEWAQYSGNYYGTPKSAVLEQLERGKQVILEIDVQGALQIRELMPEAKLIFIEPPSLDELERRLRGRGTDDETSIVQRLEQAKVELSRKNEYDIQLVNDNLQETAAQLIAYVNEQANKLPGEPKN